MSLAVERTSHVINIPADSVGAEQQYKNLTSLQGNIEDLKSISETFQTNKAWLDEGRQALNFREPNRRREQKRFCRGACVGITLCVFLVTANVAWLLRL